MAKNLYITATEARSGKSAISLGIMELLLRNIDKVGFFRPFINEASAKGGKDPDINLISSHFNLGIPYEKMYAYTTEEASNFLSQGKNDKLLEGVLNKYKELEADYDFILCEGIEFGGATASFDFDINVEVSNNLGSPVLLVSNAYHKSAADIIRSIKVYNKSFVNRGCNVIATIINRLNPAVKSEIVDMVKKEALPGDQLLYTIPDEEYLGNPTMAEIARAMNAEVLYGEEQMTRHVYGFTVAAMQLRNFLRRIEQGSLIITPGDRSDVIVACLSSVSSMSMPNITGIMLTGGLRPEEPICRLIEGSTNIVPILSVEENTFPAARIVDNIHSVISPEDSRKITKVLEIFEKNVDIDRLTKKIILTQSAVVTPKMFEFGLFQKAKTHKQHIVLPEGEEKRILLAAEALLSREIVDITLLGNEQEIRKNIARLGLHMANVNVIEPQNFAFFGDYVQTYYELRKQKGITKEMAHDIISDVNYFGTMMLYKGHADGMVSGSVHTTGDTIRPAIQIIKTKPGFSIVSSIFFMCLEDKVLVYGDCAVNANPDAKDLAEIAIASAETAKIFGIDPKIAILSYSTGISGKGEDVDKVREATHIARKISKELGLDLKIEGPIQYDAAVDSKVAKIKMPESEVAGKATVFIFPDLNTGNNTYKAVQRSAGAVAIGPILQGLNKPINDLSRGSLITDIINTVAITAIQAQSQKGLS